MKKSIRTSIAAVALAGAAVLGLTACSGLSETDADQASENLSTAAEQFEIQRAIVVFNGITDKVLLYVEGRCSIEDQGNQLEVTCKIGENQYEKHFAGLSDNVSYFAQQLETADVSVYHTRVIVKPQNLIPEFDLEFGKQ